MLGDDYSCYNSQFGRDNRIIKFVNCRVLDNGVEEDKSIWIRNGEILDGQSLFYDESRVEDITVDCKSCYLTPGFIDLQINGGFGVDFSNEKADIKEGVDVVSRKLLQTGVTAFCPTIVTSSADTYKKVLPQIERRQCSHERGAAVLGVHLEGPFINPNRKGAHRESLIRDFTDGVDTLKETYGPALSNASIVTLAPELVNAESVVKYLSNDRSMCVSLGHSASSLVQAERAVNAGARMITHLFNAMLPYHHRDPHIVGLLTSTNINRQVYFGLIADEVHTHPSALRLAWRALPSGLVLVTDAMAALGLGPGEYNLGSQHVRVLEDNRRAVLADSEHTLAGSIATIPDCIANLSSSARCSLAEAVLSASRIPAQVLGRSDHGSLEPGTSADLVLMRCEDDQLSVVATFTKGMLAFAKEQLCVRQK